MSPAVFSVALAKAHEELTKLVGFDFPKIKIGILKICLEAIEFDDWKQLDGKYSNATLYWIVELRKSEPFIDLSLAEERLVFKTLIQIYKV